MGSSVPAFPLESQSFSKTVDEGALREGKFQIPEIDVIKYGNCIAAGSVILHVPNGGLWPIELKVCSEGSVWLQKGWPELAKFYSLDCGYILVFRYEAECSSFQVRIFHSNSLEIDYPFSSSGDEEPTRGGGTRALSTADIAFSRGIKQKERRKKNLEDYECKPVIKRRISKRLKVQGNEEKETDNDSIFEATTLKTTRVRCRSKSRTFKAGTSNHAPTNVIELDDHNEMGTPLTEDSPINLSKTKVGKYMQYVDQDGYNFLGEYLQKPGNGVPLLECEIAAVYKRDIVSLVRDSTVSSNVIDSFATILGRKQAAHGWQTRSHFMPSYCWDFIKDGNYDQLRLMLYDKLLKNLGRADFIFFPLTHKRQYHFTLLILRMVEGTWHHYNPLLPRGGAKRDPCFVEAKKLHKEVSDFMKCNKAIADQVLSTGMVRREYLKDGKPYSVVPLRDGEREAFHILKNAEVEYPLVPSPVCPQQHETSLDCGVAVMYFMEHVSEGWVIKNQFEDDDMTKMRARVISCFLNGLKILEIDDASVEIMEDLPPLPKRRENYTLSVPLPQKRKRTSSSSKAEGNMNLQDGVSHLESEMKTLEEGGGDSSSTRRFPKRRPKVLGSMHPLTASEKPTALERAKTFKSENPFFKVTMHPSYVNQCFLAVPFEFARTHLNKKPGNILLQVSNGTRTWSVSFKYEKEKSRALFRSGWLAVVRDNSLKVGDVCFFILVNKIKFLFEVIFIHTTEVANPPLLLGEGDLSMQFEDGGGSSSTQKRTHEGSERMHTLTTSEKAIALERGAIAFQSENPYFKVVVQPSYIQQSFLTFPREFAKRYLRQPAGIAILAVSNETRTWSVKFKYEKSRAVFLSGWLAFARDNNLKVGDVCVFELIDKIKPLFKVVFFRTIDAANLPLSPGHGR